MRTGISFTYRFARISDRGTVVAMVGAGKPLPTAPSSVSRGPRSVVVVDEGDTFAFHAALSPKMLSRGGDGIYAVLAVFGGDLDDYCAKHLPASPFKSSKIITCACRLSPTWTVSAEIEHRFMLEVHGKKPEALRAIEPPGVWVRELPVLHVFPITR